MTHQPTIRNDSYTPTFEEKCGLVTRQIQPPIKHGCPTNAAGLLGELFAIDTTPFPCVATFKFRPRDSSKDI